MFNLIAIRPVGMVIFSDALVLEACPPCLALDRVMICDGGVSVRHARVLCGPLLNITD